MPSEWSELNKHVSAGGKIQSNSSEAAVVIEAWHQETKDLSLILSRQTEECVVEKLPRKYISNARQRYKDEFLLLKERNRLTSALEVPGAASILQIMADLIQRTIYIGMTIKAPEDRKSNRARINWLIRQLKGDIPDDLQIRLNWPGRSEGTQFPLADLLADPSVVENGKEGMQVHSFHVFVARRLGARFTQQANFISDLELMVPEFYRNIGQYLIAWRKRAPQINEARETANEVSVEALARPADADIERRMDWAR